jgi:glycosyltransferase involved in cell wall biosynthesis
MSNCPDVAVIMPVLNEENYLENAVEAVFAQNYPGSISLVLGLGPSRDGTNQLAKKISRKYKSVVLVESPTGRTAESLNLAIANCKEEIIVRVDAHSELSSGYIETAVETLQRTGADNVGGIMAAQGKTKFEKAVAAAMTSKLGVGGAPFHTGGQEGPAESVYLGVFKREALNRVGGFDPKFTRAQDWEMNHRIRSMGGKVWFNPHLVVTYRPRPNLIKLAKQYFQYGTWRREVMRTHPETLKRKSAFRYLVPPTAVIGLVLGTAFGIYGIQGDRLAIFGFFPAIAYFAITILSTISLAKKAKEGTYLLPIVLPTMQLTWGLGFLIGRYFKN